LRIQQLPWIHLPNVRKNNKLQLNSSQKAAVCLILIEKAANRMRLVLFLSK
jgi:hypothetical protein